MGSREPIKFGKRILKPNINIKGMIFCNLWVENDGYNYYLLNSMGSKWIRGFCRTFGTLVSVRADFTSRGYSFPRKIRGKRGPPVAVNFKIFLIFRSLTNTDDKSDTYVHTFWDSDLHIVNQLYKRSVS